MPQLSSRAKTWIIPPDHRSPYPHGALPGLGGAYYRAASELLDRIKLRGIGIGRDPDEILVVDSKLLFEEAGNFGAGV